MILNIINLRSKLFHKFFFQLDFIEEIHHCHFDIFNMAMWVVDVFLDYLRNVMRISVDDPFEVRVFQSLVFVQFVDWDDDAIK